ncbi:MAG: hypothetical protein ABEJ55_01025 [Halanaeroarchaeum sp.]
MAATPTETEAPSVTDVSSPSARRVYYELDGESAQTVTEIADAVDYGEERVVDLLGLLSDHGLIAEKENGYRAQLPR